MDMKTLAQWQKMLGTPAEGAFPHTCRLLKTFCCEEFDAELYLQANGIRPDGQITYQRLMLAIPKKLTGKRPAVAVPFYYPEAALGMNPETGESLQNFAGNPTMLDIVRRGYIAASADAYYLNYAPSTLPKSGAERWAAIADVFNREQPEWTGVGKLVRDTQLILDVLEQDPRVDAERLGIAGHSLGGKMAFYTGCIDPRVKVILASDFGLGWEQTNWNDPWYWGEKLDILKAEGYSQEQLLAAAQKPFCLLAGQSDNADSQALLETLEVFRKDPSKLLFINHATGHRPPPYASQAGYAYLDYWLHPEK